jgi:uncharacterized protein YidB (DUF937 family)
MKNLYIYIAVFVVLILIVVIFMNMQKSKQLEAQNAQLLAQSQKSGSSGLLGKLGGLLGGLGSSGVLSGLGGLFSGSSSSGGSLTDNSGSIFDPNAFGVQPLQF